MVVGITAETKAKVGNATFFWSVSAGRIERGQGTPGIDLAMPDKENREVRAEVRISGDFYFEQIQASCVMRTGELPKPWLVDEFEFSTREYVQMRLDAFMTEISNDPTARGYVVISGGSGRTSRGVVRLVREHFAWRKFDTKRIAIRAIRSSEPKPVIRYWLVPPGAAFDPMRQAASK